MSEYTLNEFVKSPQWDLIALSEVGSFTNGAGHHFTTVFVFGLLAFMSGVAMTINQVEYALHAYIGGTFAIITSLSLWIIIAYKKLSNTRAIFQSDIETRNILKARNIIEHYAPSEASEIDWIGLEKLYQGGNNASMLPNLISALESMYKKVERN